MFTTAPELLRAGAGEANPLLGPLLGARSVMLLDEPEHMTDRKRMLPSFHGRRMQGYGEMMADVARREIERWPLGEPFALWPRMQAISLEVVMRAVFGERRGRAPGAPARAARGADRLGQQPSSPGAAGGGRPSAR